METDAYQVEYCFESLVGRWRDTRAKASMYEVSLDHDSRVRIRTTRHDGSVLLTTSLVRKDYNSGCIIWGQPGPRQYWLSELDSRSLKWHNKQLAAFVWHRVGELPVPPKNEEGRHTQTSPSPSRLRQERSLPVVTQQAEAGVEGPEAKSRGASTSTAAQGKQFGSQKRVVIKWRRVRRSQARSQKGKRCRSQNAGRSIEAAFPSAAACVQVLSQVCTQPSQVGRRSRKLAPPPLALPVLQVCTQLSQVGRRSRKLAPPPLALPCESVHKPAKRRGRGSVRRKRSTSSQVSTCSQTSISFIAAPLPHELSLSGRLSALLASVD